MEINPKKIQIIVENTFATSKKNSEELNITVYERVFRKLNQEKKGIGKIFPIYVKINKTPYVLGVFTLNKSGTTSFFPELPNGAFFDHLTIGKYINDNNAHLTQIDDNKCKKVSPIQLIQLTNGTYHLFTFIFQQTNLIKLAPKEIIYPEVEMKEVTLLKEALITRNNYNGSGILETIGKSGPIVIQMFVLPKGTNYKKIDFFKSPLGHLADHFKLEELKKINRHVAFLKHEFQDEYQFGLLAFRYPTELNIPAYFGYGIDKSKFYFNSLDQVLKKSVFTSAFLQKNQKNS